MASADVAGIVELIVAEDGSIPADQLTPLGIRAGSHLRVLREDPVTTSRTLRGVLPDLPDLTWDDFEVASRAAQADMVASTDRR